MAKSVKELSLIELFSVGAHRGNKKSSVNPQLKGNIYGNKQGMSLIDLAKTKTLIEDTETFLAKLGQAGKQVLIVGTSSHLKDLTTKFAELFSDKAMPYVNYRWLGGTLTNWPTVRKTLKRLEKNEKLLADEKFMKALPRKEKLRIERETTKLKKVFDGLKNLKSNRPGAVLVLDAANNKVAIQEAQTNNLPVIAIANTGTQLLPDNRKFTIICNNNSTNLVNLLLQRFADSYKAGTNTIAEETSDKK